MASETNISASLQKKLDKLNKSYGARTKVDTQFITTGSIIADAVLVDTAILKEGQKGGLPLGKFIEVFGDTGCGKSTVILGACKQACLQGKIVVYLDFEGGVNESQLEGIGLRPYLNNGFYLFQIDTFEEAEEIIDELKSEATYIVFDSITAMLPGKLKDESVGDIQPGLQARYTSSFLQKYKPVVKEYPCSFIFINQVRTKLNFRGMSTVDSAGGYALKFYMDIRIKMRKSSKLVKKMNTIEGVAEVEYGALTYISAVKNRYNKPFIEGGMHVIYGKGVSNLAAYQSWLEKNNIFQGGGGGWYTIRFKDRPEEKVRGSEGLSNWVKANIREITEYIDSNGGFLLVSEDKSEE